VEQRFSLTIAFLAALLLVPTVRAIARWRGVVARPRPDRWHRKPTALLGGVAIWIALLAGTAAGIESGAFAGASPWGILLGGSLLCMLGALDDVLELRPSTKLAAQLASATVAVMFGHRFHLFPQAALDGVVSVAWIVAITNAVNLLDNMDGLAAGVVLIAAVWLGWADAFGGPVGIVGLSLVGSLGAFLLFNSNPASIFMGDSGSLSIGFLVAVLSLASLRAPVTVRSATIPIVTLLVPILDTGLVTITRILSGRAISEGGRDHVSHRLVTLGLSEREAVGFLWVLAFVAGGTAALVRGWDGGVGLLPVVVAGFALLGVYLARLSFVDESLTSLAGRRGGVARVVLELVRRRRALEMLLDAGLVLGCYCLAHALRGVYPVSTEAWRHFASSFAVVLVATLLAFVTRAVYRGVWHSTDLSDLPRYGSACLLATVISLSGTAVVDGLDASAASVLVIFGMLLFFALTGTRLFPRLLDEAFARHRAGRPVLVVGAGSEEFVAREVLRAPILGRQLIGFVNDDPETHGRRIHGYPVLGGSTGLERFYLARPFAEMIVTTGVTDVTLERVRSFAEARGLSLRLLRLELLEDRAGGATEREPEPQGVPGTGFADAVREAAANRAARALGEALVVRGGNS